MRVPLEKIGEMRANEKNIALRVHYDPEKRRGIRLESKAECLLCFNSKRVPCRVSTKTDGENGKVSVSLRFARDEMILLEIFHMQTRDEESSLIVEERVPRDLYEKAEKFLSALSVKTGEKEQEILKELTAFKNRRGIWVEGHTDLKFVSTEQMVVITDKMKEKLQN